MRAHPGLPVVNRRAIENQPMALAGQYSGDKSQAKRDMTTA